MERAADLANIRSIGTAKTVLIRTITNQIFKWTILTRNSGIKPPFLKFEFVWRATMTKRWTFEPVPRILKLETRRRAEDQPVRLIAFTKFCHVRFLIIKIPNWDFPAIFLCLKIFLTYWNLSERIMPFLSWKVSFNYWMFSNPWFKKLKRRRMQNPH